LLSAIGKITAMFEAASHMTRLGLMAIIIALVYPACCRFIPKNSGRGGWIGIGIVVFFAGVILCLVGAPSTAIKGNCNATASGLGNTATSECPAPDAVALPKDKK
jgi:MFS superfamily sulfate permease-like transporter